MPKDYSRTERVADWLRRELAELIQRELRDPRVGMVMVNDVEVSRDLAHARVYVTIVGRESEADAAEPIEALKKVGKYLGSVHCKDAKWAANPGQEWGQEVPLGQGDVGMETYLRTLKEGGYDGPLTIEREIPQEPDRQKAEIGQAVTLLNGLKVKILG